MKGFLTFTLAAGVAISTSTVVQAAGVGRVSTNFSKAPATAQSPLSVGSLSIGLDRIALTRELNRLNEMLSPQDGIDSEAGTDASVKTKAGIWSF